ncbi:unnamed protein product [Rangifer tarandus platyrhynchus]|uniref:Uncharacterized protein n=1 Tax=Rangifer tarandus platyrhynchus TaxID=3082113 RepID=A0ABN8ZXZ6_RANTA|nr:unnamed protein product [Rangifer tarandus platyrhynchus]
MPARLSPSPSWRAGRLGHPERAGRGAAGQAPAASHSVLWASARDLQLTSPKFPAPAPPRPSRRARLGACARTRSPSGRAFSAGAERAEVQGGGGGVGWRMGGTGGPFPAQAASPPLPRRQEPCAQAQVSVSTCVYTCPKPALGVHGRPPLSASGEFGARRRVCALFGFRHPWGRPGGPCRPEQRWSRFWDPLPLEEGGAHVEESLARFGGRGDAAQKMLETFPSKKVLPWRSRCYLPQMLLEFSGTGDAPSGR